MREPHLKTSSYLYHPAQWPAITHIDDILPLVKDNPGIRLFTHGDIKVLRYLINSPDVFTTPADLEARGLIFSLDGYLLSRPLHKFFNVGERMSLADLATHGEGHLATKLDGSMIAAFLLNGALIFHTKGGVSRQAQHALKTARPNEIALAKAAIEKGYTPIFEWTSPDNRIVISYETTQLRLLALRHRETGVYDDALADELAAHYGVDRPTILHHTPTLEDLEAATKALVSREDIEGAVYVGPNGLRAKLKTRSYLLIHKTVSQLFYERHALRAVLEEIDDDILPLLRDDQRNAWAHYASALRQKLLTIAQDAENQAQDFIHLEGKEAAQAIKSLDPSLQPLVFAAKRGQPTLQVLITMLSKHMGSDTKVQAVKETYSLPEWSPPPGLFLKD